MTDDRRDPELLLRRIKQEEVLSGRGRLKIFFGANAGVGKTYAMLETLRRLHDQGNEVLVGYVETHGRKETEALLSGLEILPCKNFQYREVELKEFDIDAALARKPKVIAVDELAHTNAPGSRNNKRWQDVQELLEAGVDVFTTLNVQHVESLHDLVAQITRVSVKERVPDSLLENASEIELIDLPPEQLLERLKDGKVYIHDRAASALENFFRKGNLIALRELALRYTAERVDAQMDAYRKSHEIKHPWPATERILVCVSSSPLAPRLVRSGKRMAEALRAKWTVISVEGRTPMSDENRNRLVATLRLAEQLGAETIELSGINVPDEILKCAKQWNASKIIIGKPARPRWKEIVFGSIVDDVIRGSGSIDVYVLTGDDTASAEDNPQRIRTTSAPSRYAWAFGVVVLVTLLARLMLPYFELSNVVMTYLMAIVFVSLRFGRGPSIMASLLCVAAFDFFCVPPYLTFAVSDTQYLITFVVMLIVALVISNLTVTIRQQADVARLRELRVSSLYSMSRELASTLDIKNLITTSIKHIAEGFNSKVAVFLANSDGNLLLVESAKGKYELADADIGIAEWVFRNGQSAGLGTNTLPGAGALYVPLLGATKTIGVLVAQPSSHDRFMSPEQLHLLETFGNQTAAACERAQLSEENEKARVQVKTEQLKNSLLSSISHDLRTPLATITGAASGILAANDSMNVQACTDLAREIYDESIRLNKLVSNLLDMTTLESGTLVLHKEPHPVDELVGAALNCMEERMGGLDVHTNVSSDLPMVLIDAVLIQQVFLNLLENAAKYAPGEIEVAAVSRDEEIEFSIADRGPGVSDELKSKVFEKFFRANKDGASGAGLGLAICSGIIEAHEGKIWVEDRPGGGAIFKFTLPSCGKLPEFDEDEFVEQESKRNSKNDVHCDGNSHEGFQKDGILK